MDRVRQLKELGRELRPLAPFLYLVWSDGALSDTELAAVRDSTAAGTLGPDARASLCAWLDPADPPTAAELALLRAFVQESGAASAAAPPSAALPVLDALQHVLGNASAEAAHALAAEPERGPATRAADRRAVERPGTSAASFDPASMYAFLDHEHMDVRRRVFDLLVSDTFRFVDPRDTTAYREQVLQWCTALADAGFGAMAFPAEFGGRDDVAGSIAAFETIAFHDLSLLVKYGVQFGLFGGSIFMLGTRSHHERYLHDAASLRLPGCFAMTETDHGSNVRDLETTATYDVTSATFVIDTPHAGARKDYIGNAAAHGRLAVVFAQLFTTTGNHGVHAFLVPIRDEQGRALPGVTIEDCGLKGGLNGVDNGRLAFAGVRVPRADLLDRYGSISADGGYTSPIPSPTRRFFTMLGTLVAGRVSIACASLSAAKVGLTIAIRHTASRRQFGPEGGAEVPVLDYTTMQRRLLPRLATAYALDFALKALVRRFDLRMDEDSQEIETLAAALKAYASDWSVDTLQTCREACGGLGYLAASRITTLRADTDVFTTFEGANHVLYQLVAKGRLTEYRAQFGELKLWNVARHLGTRAALRVTELNPIVTRRTEPEHLLDPAWHAAALRYREERLLSSLARRLKHRIDGGMDSFAALNDCQDHAVELGRAFAERYLLDQFQAAIVDCPDPQLRAALEPLAALHALDRLEARSAWLLEAGYIEPAKSRAIRRQINDLCAQLRPAAEALAAAFGIPDSLLRVPPHQPR
jgi:acyl-CoA oxidase